MVVSTERLVTVKEASEILNVPAGVLVYAKVESVLLRPACMAKSAGISVSARRNFSPTLSEIGCRGVCPPRYRHRQC